MNSKVSLLHEEKSCSMFLSESTKWPKYIILDIDETALQRDPVMVDQRTRFWFEWKWNSGREGGMDLLRNSFRVVDSKDFIWLILMDLRPVREYFESDYKLLDENLRVHR